ncbi:MAG: response regulator [Bacteriovorax sp.]|nr:response regulator [Bacteriovorax sp.]
MSDEKIPILIVDDEKELLEMYREFFEMDGFDVTTASSAPEGLEAYKNNLNIRLIISDANMGKMSGIEFLKALKSTYKTIPIFYLSTGALEQSEEYIKSLGGHSLLLKPFDLDEILMKIKKDLNL